MTMYIPGDDRRSDDGAEATEFLDAPIIDPEQAKEAHERREAEREGPEPSE